MLSSVLLTLNQTNYKRKLNSTILIHCTEEKKEKSMLPDYQLIKDDLFTSQIGQAH